MSEQPNERPFSESDLESPEYRDRLKRKLNCLIALLEVAMARIRRSLEADEPDVKRLERIRKNLESTLDVCLRARTALERSEELPESLPEALTRLTRRPGDRRKGPELLREVLAPKLPPMPSGSATEMTSVAEFRKFERLGRIEAKELARCDIEQLARRLQADQPEA
jgi:hypothetical protein